MYTFPDLSDVLPAFLAISLLIALIDEILMCIQATPFPVFEKTSTDYFPADWVQILFFSLLICLYHLPSKKHLLGLMLPVIILLIIIVVQT